MRFFPQSVQNLLNAGAFHKVGLLWIEARSGPVGLCSLEDEATYLVDGTLRTYAGSRGTLSFPSFQSEIGFSPRRRSVTVAAGIPTVEAIIRASDVNGVRCAVDYAIHDPETYLFAGLVPAFRGRITGDGWSRSRGDAPVASIDMISRLADLDVPFDARKTHEDQKRRGGDQFRRYGTEAGVEAE